MPDNVTRRLYLMRHAQAAWANPGERDFDRRLDDSGYDQAEFIADRAADKGYRPALILSSTAVRCRETTEALRRAFTQAPDIAFIDEMYNAASDTYLSLALEQEDRTSVMLVGHNPTMEAVVEALIGHAAMEATLPEGFPAAGLLVLDAILPQDPDQGGRGARWQVIEMLTP